MKLIKKTLNFILYFIVGSLMAAVYGINRIYLKVRMLLARKKEEAPKEEKPVSKTRACKVIMAGENGEEKVLYGDFITTSGLDTAAFVEWK